MLRSWQGRGRSILKKCGNHSMRFARAVCPKCGGLIPPAEVRRIDFERIECPVCGERFAPRRLEAGKADVSRGVRAYSLLKGARGDSLLSRSDLFSAIGSTPCRTRLAASREQLVVSAEHCIQQRRSGARIGGSCF